MPSPHQSPPAAASASRRPAKFLLPRPRHALRRPRLHALLDEAAPARGIWLQGRAGAGKSTLAAAWAGEHGRTLAWFRVDATDLDLGSALAALAGLLATGTRRRLPPALLQAPPPGDAAAVQAHARRFFRAFHALAGPLVLVFDDVHAAPSATFESLLQVALDEAPEPSTVLMTSRHPPHGVLLESVARGELWTIEAEALDFTADEAEALLAPRLGADRARLLHRRTGGWAAGLTLLAARGADSADAEQLVADFFSQCVLGVLDAAQRRLLAAVSLLPEVDDEALQALGLGPEAADHLDALSERLGFVQRLGRGRRCWRLHDLLGESVQAQFEASGSPAWRQATLQAAAAVHGRQGRLQAALALLVRAGEHGLAQAQWCRQAPALLRQGRAQELQRAFSVLDPARMATDATALWRRGQAAALAQEADTAEWFDRAWAALDASQEPAASQARLRVASAALNARFSGWRSYAGREDWLQRFLAAWPVRGALEEADEGLRVDKSALLVFVSHRLAPLPEPEQQALMDRLLATIARRPDRDAAPGAPDIDPNQAVSASSSLVEWCNYRGDRVLLARLADLTLPWLSAPGLAGATHAAWWITYGWVSVRLVLGRSDIPEGEAAVERGVQVARDCGAPDITFYGLTNLVAAALSRHDLALAEARLRLMEEAASQRTGAPEQPTQQATMHVLAARWLTLRGEAATALVRMERALELARASEFPASETWIYHLGHVQVLTALGRETEAAALAGRLAAAYEGLRSDYLLALARLAHCAQAWREGREPDPDDVRACVQLAARHAWHAVGNFLHPQVARLAAAALALGVEGDFVRQTIRQRRLQAPHPDAVDWPWPLQVRALGGFEVRADGQALDFGARPQKKPLDLLRLLVARGPAPVETATVLDTLWPEADGDRAKGSLDMAVLRLRKLLGDDEAVRLDHGRLGLNRQRVWVDSWAWAAGQPLPYAGPLFGAAPPELPWAAQREALHLQFLRRCHAEGERLERAGRPGEALALFESALAQDPLDEAQHRGAIRCLLALGETAAARRAYERCRAQLQAGLGVAPAAATLALLAAAAPGP